MCMCAYFLCGFEGGMWDLIAFIPGYNLYLKFAHKRSLPSLKCVGWLVILGLTALRDSISVYTEPSPKEREKEEKGTDESINGQTENATSVI